MMGLVPTPTAYLITPGLLGLGTLSMLYFTFEPVLSARWTVWLLVIALLAIDAAALRWYGPARPEFLAVNNLLQVLAVVGVSNLWAQSGMKASENSTNRLRITVYTSTAVIQSAKTCCARVMRIDSEVSAPDSFCSGKSGLVMRASDGFLRQFRLLAA